MSTSGEVNTASQRRAPTGPVWEAAKAERNWLVWKKVKRKRRDGTMQIAKVPLDPVGGYEANRIDAATLTWDEARAVVAAKGYDGVGYVPRRGSAMVGDDLDNCYDKFGNPDEIAQELLALGETYCERSPSGTGLRVLRARPVGVEPLSTEAEGVGTFEIVEPARGKYFTVRGKGCGKTDEVRDAPRTREFVTRLYAARTGRVAGGGKGEGEQLPEAVVAHILRSLKPETDYNEWISVGLATKWCLGEEGFGHWDQWSAKAANYDGPEATREKWDTLSPSGDAGGGSLMRRFEAEGNLLPEGLRRERRRAQALAEFDALDGPRSSDEEDFEDPFAGGPHSLRNAREQERQAEIDRGTPEGAARLNKESLVARITRDLASWRAGDVSQVTLPEPPMIVDGLVPASVFGFVGPGAVAKTTLAIQLSIRTILGMDWWGFAVRKPGPVVFYSKEDERDVIRSRLQKIGMSMGLSAAEWARVGNEFIIRDLSGSAALARLVEADKHGTMQFGELVEEVTETVRMVGASLSWFDPGIDFGAGEQFLNTGEAALMQAGRRIATATGSATGIIHHVGQAAAREKITDMYAGRGGSAFGDNARAIFAMHKVNVWDPAEMVGITEQEVLNELVQSVSVAKLSYGRRPQERLFVRHGPGSAGWWDMDLIRGVRLQHRSQQRAQAQANADMDAVKQFLLDEAAAGKTHTRQVLAQGNVEVLDRHGKKLGRDRVREALGVLIGSGAVVGDSDSRSGKAGKPGTGALIVIQDEISARLSEGF